MKIKIGMRCMNVKTGVSGVIIDLLVTRYQMKNISGWQYDIENLVILPSTFKEAAHE